MPDNVVLHYTEALEQVRDRLDLIADQKVPWTVEDIAKLWSVLFMNTDSMMFSGCYITDHAGEGDEVITFPGWNLKGD